MPFASDKAEKYKISYLATNLYFCQANIIERKNTFVIMMIFNGG